MGPSSSSPLIIFCLRMRYTSVLWTWSLCTSKWSTAHNRMVPRSVCMCERLSPWVFCLECSLDSGYHRSELQNRPVPTSQGYLIFYVDSRISVYLPLESVVRSQNEVTVRKHWNWRIFRKNSNECDADNRRRPSNDSKTFLAHIGTYFQGNCWVII